MNKRAGANESTTKAIVRPNNGGLLVAQFRKLDSTNQTMPRILHPTMRTQLSKNIARESLSNRCKARNKKHSPARSKQAPTKTNTLSGTGQTLAQFLVSNKSVVRTKTLTRTAETNRSVTKKLLQGRLLSGSFSNNSGGSLYDHRRLRKRSQRRRESHHKKKHTRLTMHR